MGRLAVVIAVIACAACVEPRFTRCPDVDCPRHLVCDGQGGCALPQQLEQCGGKADGAPCTYSDRADVVIDGTCAGGVCLPVGCGNSVVTPPEVCDDGNTLNGDGCSADCRSTEICGNGVTDPAAGEQCDDGNLASGDGCQGDCKIPRCGDGVHDVDLNEACDHGVANSSAPDAPCRPSCQLPRCGDNVRDPTLGEVCDDGNNTPGDGCAGDCKSNETCGNSVVDVFAGEVCDDGNTSGSDGCSADCRSTESCGNAVVDAARGEVCDDGNVVSGDGCSSDCRSLEVCGNGVLDTILEECDLGAANSNAPNAMCRTTCRFPACGDGVFDTLRNEQCDDGMVNADVADACRTNCQLPRCGDTIRDTGEACDDGNYLSGDGCSGDCRSNEVCGNGYIDTAVGEQCDAGTMNSNAPNAPCRTSCVLPRCGDLVVDTALGESCDAGAANSNAPDASCRTSCQPQRCGDGIRDTGMGEVCDDGNVVSGDACSADCRSNETCGNAIIDAVAGEQCDAGTMNSNAPNAPCRTNCRLPRCGDGAVDTNLGEACDAGMANSSAPNASCRTTCQPRRCGDSIVDNGFAEVCDDGNSVAGDGCSPDCRSNETCGNGIVDIATGEQCDAGGLNSNNPNAPCRPTCNLPRCGDAVTDTAYGEACDLGTMNSNAQNATCRTNCQPQRCGDNILDNTKGEVCDDGNVISGDNCSGDCRSNETCGNGIVDTARGEECDDGNAVNNDFCHTNCTLPRCGDGVVDFNEQCDAGMANSNNPNAACRPGCVVRRCGDLIVDNLFEACDDGNLLSGDGCSPDCSSNETCGNSIVDSAVGEACDDGNALARDGCSVCEIEDAVILTPGLELPNSSAHSLAYDAARQRVVGFFGWGGLETWEWDGVSWTQMKPRNSPAQRYGQGFAYDPVRRRVVLFGGFLNGQHRNDTWEWDGNDWIQRVLPTSPTPRYLTAMAFDANRKTIVLYGGSGQAPVDDTWEYDGTTWTKLTTTGSPGLRSGHRLVWDGTRNNLVLASGPGSPRTWTFNGVTRTWTDAAAQPFPTATNNAVAYDPKRQRVVLYRNNGATYEWNGTSWSTISAPTPLAPTGFPFANLDWTDMVYDAARGHLVLAAGYGPDTQSSLPNYWLNRTWRRIDTTWSAAPAWVSPGARFRTTGAYDPVRGKLVMFGGGSTSAQAPTPNTHNDTWEWDGISWTQRTATTPPSVRASHWMDYNRATGTIMLWGGGYFDGTTKLAYADLHSYNSSTPGWSVPAMSGGRTGVRNSAMAYDVANNRIVTFGGRTDSPLATNQDTWTWSGATGWVMANPATKPPARRGHALAYDPVRQRTVLFAGLDASGALLSDTWEWNGTTWAASTASGPSARKGHSMFYNPDARRVMLFGGAIGAEDLWEYSGSKWTQRPIDPDVTLTNIYRPAIGYDAARHQITLYGGRGNGSSTQATRLLRYRPHVTTEACLFSSIDYDNDGLPGCADPDCWSVCTPLCPPGATGCAMLSPRCGDGTCDPIETCDSCPSDCTAGCPAPLCGDFRCRGETRASCPSDCYL